MTTITAPDGTTVTSTPRREAHGHASVHAADRHAVHTKTHDGTAWINLDQAVTIHPTGDTVADQLQALADLGREITVQAERLLAEQAAAKFASHVSRTADALHANEEVAV